MKKKLLSVFLCLLILLSYPITASARAPGLIHIDVNYDDGYCENANSNGTSASIVSQWDYAQLKYAFIHINMNDFNFMKGDRVSLKLYVDNYQYYSNELHSVHLCIGEYGSSYSIDITDYYLSYNQGYLLLNFDMPQDAKNENLFFTCYINCDSTSMDIVEFHVSGVDVKVDTADSSFMSNVKDSLKNLLDKITNGFDNLTSMFDVDNTNSFAFKIKSWFDGISNSISSFISGLGDRISGFFDNIWSNINDKVDGIEQKVKDFKQEVSDWFDDLFKPEEGYFDNYKATWETWFSEHFGFLYDSYFLVIDTFVLMQNAFDVEGSGVIYIPSVDLPLPNASYTIIEERVFDFNELLQSHEFIYTLIEGFRMGATVIIYLGLVLYGKKSLEKILAEREL